jgi:hypothetical protein
LYKVDHLASVEDVLKPVLGPRSLGVNAVFCDAIPWKWNNADRSLRPFLLPQEWATAWRIHAKERVGTIAEALDQEVILILGELNRWLWKARLSDGPFVRRDQHFGMWRGTVVSSLHPNARKTPHSGRFDGAYKAAVSEALKDALET